MTPSASRRSTRRLTAGALSATCAPMSENERRAFWRSSATILWSTSSICATLPLPTQRSGIERASRQADHSAMSETVATPRPAATEDYMPLHGIDHVEFFVGNAKQAAFFYTRAFGFKLVAYSGLETGTRDRASFVVQQGRIRLVLTGALQSDSPIAEHHRHHGDGVKVIALSVPDVDHAW